MSEILGSYAFVSSLRRGISSQISNRDGDPGTPTRATVPISVNINEGALTATANLELYGPGEIVNCEASAVIRTWPRPNVFDAEANLFPLIEFDQADLPWRFTPAAPTINDRLRPWIVLIVLEDSEVDGIMTAGPHGKLPSIVIKSAHTSLPNLAQSWAWAHVQVSGQKTVSPAETANILANNPHYILSRLLCPRRMKERTTYTAYLVPAFERGRLAGLRLPVPDAVKGLDPAWTDGSANVELPVFFQWRFQTAPKGDFEFLVRLLRARPLPKTVGIRDMDVNDPGAGLPAAAPHPLGLEGALKSPATESTVWTNPEQAGFIPTLRDLLNVPAQMLASALHRLIVAPPLYGRWHSAQDTLKPGEVPVWFQGLNSDPRNRTGSGLGTQVIQTNQRPLMAGAWDQVEGILAANEERRRLKLSREMSARLLVEYLASPEPERLIQVTGPVLQRIMGSPVTIRTLMQRSPITDAVMEPQFRRISRPLGPLGRRQGRAQMPRATNLLQRLNTGELNPAPPPKTPDSLPTDEKVAQGLVPGWATAAGLAFRKALRILLLILAVIFAFVAIGFFFAGGIAIAVAVAAAVAVAVVASNKVRDQINDTQTRVAVRDGAITPEIIQQAPALPGFTPVVTAPDAAGPVVPTSLPHATPGGTDSVAAKAFREAAATLLSELHTPPAPGLELVPVNLTAIQSKVMIELDPRKTFATALHNRVILGPGILWQPDDPIDEIMIAPVFPDPMYLPLSDLSQDWLLPGLDQIPPNTATLAITNQKFVESYMVGINHEMSRELRWNEYPCDLRGTYFRQFWDVTGVVPPPGQTEENLRDIKPIHAWRKQNDLGQNSSRQPLPGGQEHLVLLIRGDLLRRYPNTEVYAVKCNLNDKKQRVLEEDKSKEKHPIFTGKLKPDVSFFGFELVATEAKGSPDVTKDQGWYFVLQEQPAEPRFGLDIPEDEQGNPEFGTAPAKRDDLNWGDLVANATEFNNLDYVDLNQPRPDIAAMADRNGAAWHADSGQGPVGTHSGELAYLTLQKPVRIAIHGSDMIPHDV